jgi:hypothetical protein
MEATIKQRYIELLTRSEPVLGYEPENQTFIIGDLESFFHQPDKIERVHVPETQLFEVLRDIIFPKTEISIKIDGVYFPI